MSQIRREVVFMGRDEGLSSTMDNIRQSANDTARTMIEQARISNNSASSVVRSYEDQIRALERKNAMVAQSSRIEIEERRKMALAELESKQVINPIELHTKRTELKKEQDQEIDQIKNERVEITRDVFVKEIKNTVREDFSINEDDKGVKVKEKLEQLDNFEKSEAVKQVRLLTNNSKSGDELKSKLDQSPIEDTREIFVKEIEKITREKINKVDKSLPDEEERTVKVKEIEETSREKIEKFDNTVNQERRSILVQEIEQVSRQKVDRLKSDPTVENRDVLINEVEQSTRKKIDSVDGDKQQRIEQVKEKYDEKLQDFESSSIFEQDKKDKVKEIDATYRGEITDQKNYEAQDKLQLQVLKDILEAIKSTSRQEISSEEFQARKNSQNQQIRELSDVDGAVELAQELMDQNNPQPNPNQPPNPKQPNNGKGGTMVNVLNDANRVVNSDSPVDAASGSAGLLGLAKNPAAASILAAFGIGYGAMSTLATRETSASELAALQGTSSERIAQSDIGATNYGQSRRPLDYNVTLEQFLSQNMPQAIKSAGTKENAEERAIQQIEIDKGLGLRQGTGAQLEKLIRVSGESSAQTLAATIYNALRDAGELGEDGKDLAKFDEYMRGFIQMSEQAFMQFGTTNNQGTIGAIKEFTKLGGNFEREDYTVDATRRLNAGLIQGGSAESQAVKFDILRRNNPELGFAELQAEMQQGLNSEKYASGIFEFAKNSSKDINNQALIFNEMTGGQMRMKDILQMFKSGEFSLNALDEKQEITRDPKIATRAENAASTAQTNIDFSKEALKDIGTKLGDLINQVVGIRTDVSNSLEYAKTVDR